MVSQIPVLFVVNSVSGGGAENSVRVITNQLLRNGIDAHVCAINSIEIDKNDCSNVDNFHVLSREWKDGLGKTIRNFLDFRSLIKLLKPRFVVANCELPELYVALGAPKGCRIIAVEHTSNPWAQRKMMGVLVRLILKLRKSHWITVSNTAEPIWVGSKYPEFVANPIEINEQEGLRSEEIQDLVFVGRLRPEKRPDWVIRVGIEADLSVYLYGEGYLRDELEVKYTASTSNVHFKGFKRHVWSEISNDALIIVPSDYEGDGMVVAEAILSGKRVLLRDNQDLRRFHLPEGNYFLDETDLKEKVIAWKNSGKKEFLIPKEIIRDMKKKRNLETISSTWMRILKIGTEKE